MPTTTAKLARLATPARAPDRENNERLM
ncbi:hypothetical protein FHS05_000261 [Microbacterium endophyticum]|nr:hypothetical protein [Microbacterium endophyticum]